MYDRFENHMKKYVEDALKKYKDDENCGAGYQIIRYASKGLLKMNTDINGEVFLNWYPNNPAYIILRLAKAGKLSYKESNNGN